MPACPGPPHPPPTNEIPDGQLVWRGLGTSLPHSTVPTPHPPTRLLQGRSRFSRSYQLSRLFRKTVTSAVSLNRWYGETGACNLTSSCCLARPAGASENSGIVLAQAVHQQSGALWPGFSLFHLKLPPPPSPCLSLGPGVSSPG